MPVLRKLLNGIGLLLVGLGGVCLTSCQSKNVNFLKQDAIQLAPPRIIVDSSLFNQSATLHVRLDEADAELRYTLDGNPVTTNATLYTEPVVLDKTTPIRVKAFHPKFTASEEQELTVRKLERDISQATVKVTPDPHANYPGEGAKSLHDGLKGTTNFRQGKYWLGFQSEQITVTMGFKEDTPIQKLILGTLRDQGSWIFVPHSITVGSNGIEVGSVVLDESTKEGPKELRFIDIPIEKEINQEITITINSLSEIPEWHPGKGTLPWFFIDEIMVE
nr:chitobiase/beta-hexosaminidase C-terminal domain-containing protein [Allomuricauda sp.]